MSNLPLVIDMHVIRIPVRDRPDGSDLTDSVPEDSMVTVEAVIKLLNDALATELVCVLRYRRHHFMALANHSQAAAKEFLAHANEELGHADQLAERIVQLGGAPDFSPKSLLQHSHIEYIEGASLASMIRDALVAGGLAIDSYRGMVQFIGESDPTTRRMLESILAVEEEHADELSALLVSRFEASAQALDAHRQSRPIVGFVLQLG